VKKSIIHAVLAAVVLSFILCGCESEEEKAARLAEIENIKTNIMLKMVEKNLLNAISGNYGQIMQTTELEREIRELEYRLSQLQR
jgi:predicted component of type VI protein secretion system